MNIIKHKLARSPRHGFSRNGLSRHGARRGLSVIEVLTSIVVALIGVFGVLAMIPFSVKQTQSGLDQDAATTLARNALSNFEASGHKIVSDIPGSNIRQLNWIAPSGASVTTAVASPMVCIDPLGILEGTDSFPFNSSDPPFEIPSVTLALPGGQVEADGTRTLLPFDIADARRMFRLTDELVFEQADDLTVEDSDLNGPQQLFNEGPRGILNRQSVGSISWCAIAEPVVNSSVAVEVDSYKLHVLVFKDRIIDSEMDAAMVTSPITAGQVSTITINRPLGAFSADVRRNDWVMLRNSNTSGRPDIAFARVTNFFSEPIDPDAPIDPTATSELTIDGPDFDFSTPTAMVHLRDVVAVFTRTIKLETSSEWTFAD